MDYKMLECIAMWV